MRELLGSFHPVAVHFPIALVVTAALAEVLRAGSPHAGVSSAARFMLLIAAPLALLSAVFGFAAAGTRTFGPEFAPALEIHRIAGVASSVLTVLSAGLCESAARRREPWRVSLYRGSLFLTAVMTAATGHFGAALTHGPSYLLFR